MKEKMSTFQIILFAVSIFLIIGGVLTFALKKTGGPGSNVVQIELWGTLPVSLINSYTEEINKIDKDSVKVTYRQFIETNFESELVNALASGIGPDAVIFPDNMLIKHEDKIFTIPYQSYPQATFKNTFVEASDILLKNNGISGLPFIIDPLVLYWNRTTLNSNGVSNPPQYWDELLNLIPTLTRRDSTGNISKATISMGEFRNIKNASDILTTLVFQAGNPIIVRNSDNSFSSVFKSSSGYSVAPADAAINFFIQFSNPAKTTYTWNRSLPNSDEMFLSGDLTFYIGFASERDSLVQRNPNLNFGVAMLPQSRQSVEDNRRVVGGKIYFLSVLNASSKIAGAFDNLSKLTSSTNMSLLQNISNYPPVRRDLLSAVPTVDYKDVFNRSVLITKPFFDPDPIKADQILADAIESVTSGRATVSEVLTKVEQDLNLLIKK